MTSPRSASVVVCLALSLALAACASHVSPATQPTAPPRTTAVASPTPTTVPAVQRDLVGELLAESTRAFETGERELQIGHLDGARTSFDQALDLLLSSPSGVQGDPRIKDHFEQLVERISAHELTTLAQGDGFTEQAVEPASIDDLLRELTFAPPPPATASDAVARDLEAAGHDIDIPLNERVLSFVELFSGRLKGYLEDGLGRAARYLPMIQDVFRAEGLPLDLAYVPLIESAFKPNALSRAKARGLWQFMSYTGRENGLKQDWYVDERAEPEKATRAAAQYLKSLYATFGDWHLALASYNGGPGRVQRAMQRAGSADFWSLSTGTRYLPRETRDYVPLILAAIIVAKNPASYGLEVAPLAVPSVETISVPKPVDLRRVAEWADTSVELLQELNPELRRWTTPIRATDYQLRVPMGAGEGVRAKLTEAVDEELANLSWHTVKKGESLLTIARKLKVSRSDLAEANYLSAKAKVTPGQQLIIPRAPTALLARTNPTAPGGSARADVVVAASMAPKAAAPRTYTVKAGDTLFSIARQFDTTVESLRTWNRLRSTGIQAGQRLQVRAGALGAVATR